MCWCGISNHSIFKHHSATDSLKSHILILSHGCISLPLSCFDQGKPLIKGLKNSPILLRPFHHDPATTVSARYIPQIARQKFLCKAVNFAGALRALAVMWQEDEWLKRDEDKVWKGRRKGAQDVGAGEGRMVAAAWANPRGERLGSVHLVQRGPFHPFPFHPCQLNTAGVFCIMHAQHVRRTLTQYQGRNLVHPTQLIHTARADLLFSISFLLSSSLTPLACCVSSTAVAIRW